VALYEFKNGDILRNTLAAYPEYNFFIYEQNRYINKNNIVSGAYHASITNVPPGYVNLYELNINKDFSKESIYPLVLNDQDNYFRLSSLNSASQAALNSGVEVTGSYPLSSSIQYNYYASSNTSRPKIKALQNTINYYAINSPHYQYSSSDRDFGSIDLGLISTPAIIYGGGLKKGSVSLKYYVSGALQAELVDKRQNGELVQVSGAISANDGKIAGVVLYNEGFIFLTGAWDLNTSHTENYGPSSVPPRWIYFGSSISGTVATPSSSYDLNFQAIEKIPTISMLAHANRGELNYSNNPSFISSSAINTPNTGSLHYLEYEKREIKNIVSSSFIGTTGSFEKITYITKVGVYDKYKNLIAVADLANPVRKREKDHFTFKLKLDM
jgi:hypothetical protein